MEFKAACRLPSYAAPFSNPDVLGIRMVVMLWDLGLSLCSVSDASCLTSKNERVNNPKLYVHVLIPRVNITG